MADGGGNDDEEENLNDNEVDFEDQVLLIFNENELEGGQEGENDFLVDSVSSSSGEELPTLVKKKDSKGRKREFDRSLPGAHSYLGRNMTELQGRTIHESGDTMLLPLFYLPGVVLVPGQTLPLNLFHPQPISMMKRVVEADKTFGLLMGKSQEAFHEELAEIGITCEIYSVKEVEEYGVTTMSLIAAGRQRFRIMSKDVRIDGVIMGKVRILPELDIGNIPRGALLCSSQNHPNFYGSELLKFNNTKHLKQDIAVCSTSKAFKQSMSVLPWWIYKLYNPCILMERLMNDIKSWNENLNFSSLPSDPAEFSHWVTANLPLTNELKVQLLEADTAIIRLQKLLEIMRKCSTSLACKSCDAVIASKKDLFSMTSSGLQAAYVNPGGVVHETLTFKKAEGLRLQGRASTEYSWFPGYAWTIACCEQCAGHIGWKFTASKRGLEPKSFWGLTRASLMPVFHQGIDILNNEEHVVSTDEENDSNRRSLFQYESSI